jgi:hypothetical protein
MNGAPPSILLVADPGAATEIAERLAESLPKTLASDRGEWNVEVRCDPYPIGEQSEVADVVRTVDPSSETQDVVIYLTDLPRRLDTAPVVADISLVHRFGLISIPGVGGLSIGRRIRDLAQTVVAEVTGQPQRRHAFVKHLRRMQDNDVVRYVAPTALSRLRLLVGMVYANRPWRLAAGMSRVIMAAFATGAVSLVYPTIWQLSDTMGPWRMSVATIVATAAMTAWLILEHELWERPKSTEQRDKAILYNAATVVTLSIGVALFHVGLFILLLVTAWWTLPPQLIADTVGHPVDPPTLLRMAWLVAAIATLGGALGSGMEDDEAVKEAAYGVRQRERFDKKH